MGTKVVRDESTIIPVGITKHILSVNYSNSNFETLNNLSSVLRPCYHQRAVTSRFPRGSVPFAGDRDGLRLRLIYPGSIGHSVHWQSVKCPVISLILDTPVNKVHPYLSVCSLISTICCVKAGILNVCLLATPPNDGLRTFLRGVASSVIYYDPFITRVNQL